MASVKMEKECDPEKDGHSNQEKVANDEKLTDSLSSVDHIKTAEGEPATEEEIKNLFHVVDDIPIGVWLASFVASAERFAWFGATGPLRKANLMPKFALSFLDTEVFQRTTFNMTAIARSQEHWASNRPLHPSS